MRIYADRLYVIVVDNPGLSGFQRWGEQEMHLMRGDRARKYRSQVMKEYKPNDDDLARLEDGHLPDYQPRLNGKEAAQRIFSEGVTAVLIDYQPG